MLIVPLNGLLMALSLSASSRWWLLSLEVAGSSAGRLVAGGCRCTTGVDLAEEVDQRDREETRADQRMDLGRSPGVPVSGRASHWQFPEIAVLQLARRVLHLG